MDLAELLLGFKFPSGRSVGAVGIGVRLPGIVDAAVRVHLWRHQKLLTVMVNG
jgi:hypothetical protein